MPPGELLLFFAVVFVVFIGFGLVGIIKRDRKR
jgi:hypothetical protein